MKGRPIAFDFKKEYRSLNQPKTKPSIVEVPRARFIVVEAAGMHIGPYGDKLAPIAPMHKFATSQGLAPDFSDVRRHHEIYLSDPRKGNSAKMKTVFALSAPILNEYLGRPHFLRVIPSSSPRPRPYLWIARPDCR